MDVHHRALTALAALALAATGCRHREDPPPTPAPTDPGDPPSAEAGPGVRGHVGEVIALDGSGSTGAGFTWTTSDGQAADGAVAELTFDAPGHYTAVLSVTDALGRTDTDSTSVTVTWPRLDPAPVAGSAVVSDPDGAGDTLYVALADFDAIAVVDVGARAVDRWIPVCDAPRSVAVGHGAVWVACAGDDVLARVDVGGGDEVTRTPLGWGRRPFAVVARADDVLVSLQGTGELAVVDPASGAVVRTVAVADDLRGLAATSDRVLATRYRSPDDGGVAVLLDRDLGDPVAVDLPIDPGPDSDTNSRGLPNLLQRPVVRPDGRVAAVPGSKANIERGLFRDGQPMTFETTCRADLRVVALDDPAAPAGTQLDAAIFDDRDQAVAAAYSPDGDWLLVLHSGMETLDILDAYTLERAGAVQDVGSGAEGLWVSPDGGSAWVYAATSRTLTGYDLGAIAIPSELAAIDLVPPGGEVLPADVLTGKQLFGRSVDPRMSTAGYLSCASCHPEGDHDGRTWDFTDRGEGLRNTISLVGRAGAAPIHWSANFDEVQDFENDIRGPQAGAGFLDDAVFAGVSDPLGAPKAGLSAELDALAAYVASLDTPYRSPHRDPDGALPAQAALGEAVFLDPLVGCVTCHPAPAYTDSAWLAPGEPLLHDVGTLGPGSGDRRGVPLVGLDTPSLVNLHATAPYLHNGSAGTVRDAIVGAGDDLHGVTSGLTDAELDALALWLLAQ